MNKRLAEILGRKAEIRSILKGENTDLNLDDITKELDSLDSEERSIRQKITLAERLNKNDNEGKELENPEIRDKRLEDNDNWEQRGIDLKERRAVTVGKSNIVMAKHSSEDVKDTFNEVSSLVDMVTVTPLDGGESYERGYVVSYGEGGEVDKSGNYKDIETKFDYASINKQKITAYQEEPEEISKLAPAAYGQITIEGTSKAVRKRLTKDILVGDGTAGHLVGIFNNGAKAIEAETDLKIKDIDENTLDDIIYSYGGEEDVEENAVLILNKKDLAAFAKVKGADKKKAYEIINKGNKGTINGVAFIINSACKALSAKETKADDYCMAYGNLSNYELAVFSQLDVQRSDDFKFKQGQIAHRGSIYCGGNVVAKNGFIRVKKGA
ncbi:capsid protein [Clostridium sp. K25]|uniref:phage major capsid protein n=1 Tax=Clostridium TaxID=1485 RepID=UPI0004DAFDD8|nr:MULTISPECIES: phage major capsid protein [Clostridium]KEI09299.1 capsid protein [Clostridium sp. K25]KEI12618.1 capsid protein [Clostridium novyi B str. NCTC 9691]